MRPMEVGDSKINKDCKQTSFKPQIVPEQTHPRGLFPAAYSFVNLKSLPSVSRQAYYLL